MFYHIYVRSETSRILFHMYIDYLFLLYILNINFLQFAGFSAESLSERIMDANCYAIVTAGEMKSLD